MRQEEVVEFHVEGSDEPEPLEILLAPTGLHFNNASKDFGAIAADDRRGHLAVYQCETDRSSPE